MKKKRKEVLKVRSIRNIIFILVLAVVVTPMFLHAGDFLSIKPEPNSRNDFSDSNTENSSREPLKKTNIPPVTYNHLSKTINGYKQEIDILEVSLKDGKARIKPALSFEMIFGFEKLSKIVEREDAYAAVNSGFFYEYGRPGGMVAIDGKLITNSTGKYPVFTVVNNEAVLTEVNTKLWIEYDGKRLDINNINAPGKQGNTTLYTPVYGTDNRAKIKNITAVVENGCVTRIAEYTADALIPRNGMLLTFYTSNMDSIPLQEGDRVEFKYDCGFEGISQAYECGSWIVKDGRVVIGDRDAWVGVMTNRDPRTVIGLKDKYTVVLLTVDGRQPGYSAGLTGKELGQLLLSLGIKNAAMLDGGASTEMIVKNKIVNRPSYKGQERPLGGALVVKYNN